MDTTVETADTPRHQRHVAVALQRCGLEATLGIAQRRRHDENEGRVLWSEAGLIAKTYQLTCLLAIPHPSEKEKKLTADLEWAIKTQGQLKLMRACNAELASHLTAQPEQNVGRALSASLSALQHARYLHFHAGRVAAASDASRRRQRLMAKVVRDTLDFATDQGQPNGGISQSTVPVIVCGNYVATGSGNKFGRFPMKSFLKELTKRAIVVIAEEQCTTRCCGVCG
jgi:hypothetical protein